MPKDYFTRVKREFPRYAARFVGKPCCYVEIGCWLGGSANYVCNSVLTHPESRGYGIDPYLSQSKKFSQAAMDDIQQSARARLKPHTDARRWQFIVGKSQEVLPTWPHGKIDFLYIDGSHHSHDVMLDFCMAWPRLCSESPSAGDSTPKPTWPAPKASDCQNGGRRP